MTTKTKADKTWGRVQKDVAKEAKRMRVTKSDYNSIWKKGRLGAKPKAARKTKGIF